METYIKQSLLSRRLYWTSKKISASESKKMLFTSLCHLRISSNLNWVRIVVIFEPRGHLQFIFFGKMLKASFHTHRMYATKYVFKTNGSKVAFSVQVRTFPSLTESCIVICHICLISLEIALIQNGNKHCIKFEADERVSSIGKQSRRSALHVNKKWKVKIVSFGLYLIRT